MMRLNDSLKIALSYLNEGIQPESLLADWRGDAPGGGLLPYEPTEAITAKPISFGHDCYMAGRLSASCDALVALGLAEYPYIRVLDAPYGDNRHEGEIPWEEESALRKQGWKPNYKASGYRYRLTDDGIHALNGCQPFSYRCCESCVQLMCVCSCKTFCANPEHHGGCHGTHD